jgi:hypothetical protein
VRIQPTRNLSRKTPEPLTDTVESEHRDIAIFLAGCEPSLSHRINDIIKLGLVDVEWLEAYARWPKEVRNSLLAKAVNMAEAEKLVFDLEIPLSAILPDISTCFSRHFLITTPD